MRATGRHRAATALALAAVLLAAVNLGPAVTSIGPVLAGDPSNLYKPRDGYDGRMSADPTSAAPALELVRRFINTRDIEAGTDALRDASGLRDWLAASSLWAGDVRPDDLDRARRLREALRAAAAANHDRTALPASVLAVLNNVAARADITLSFTAERAWRTAVRAKGVDGALGTLVVHVTEAMTAGAWPRLKVCANDRCRWAFYDTSRAATGKWCSMRLCGNRAKQQAWRDRRSTAGFQ